MVAPDHMAHFARADKRTRVFYLYGYVNPAATLVNRIRALVHGERLETVARCVAVLSDRMLRIRRP
jgi:hypothetical protein